MEILNIKRALERKLIAIVPSVPIALEGVKFTPPSTGMYQYCQFLINSPDDPTFPVGYHRENIQFQVFICDPSGIGTASAIARAELIRTNFAKGTSLVEGPTRIYILRTPQIGSASVVNDRIVVPVLISVIAEVYNY